MRKPWLLALPLLACLLLAGYVIAGPYLAIAGINRAIEQRDTALLQRHVDFAALRVNLKAQLEDALVRRAGPSVQQNPFGAAALALAGKLAGAGVDTAVTPAGIAALLEGHGLVNRALGNTVDGDTYGAPAPPRPLRDARHRFESSARFVATAHTRDGRPLVFVFTRNGLRWKLTDIRLPLPASPPA